MTDVVREYSFKDDVEVLRVTVKVYAEESIAAQRALRAEMVAALLNAATVSGIAFADVPDIEWSTYTWNNPLTGTIASTEVTATLRLDGTK
jgi:hypothetical protein